MISMARYLNVYKEDNIVARQAYEGEYGRWICGNHYVAVIETIEGTLLQIPIADKRCLRDYTADELLKEEAEDCSFTIWSHDCEPRDAYIKDNITEWVCNEGCVSGSSLVEAVCAVVSLLTEFGMWKEEYAKCIDVKKIKKDWDEE